MSSFEDLMTAIVDLIDTEDSPLGDVSTTLKPVISKLSEGSRSTVKRCKERCLEEASQLLKKIPGSRLCGLEEQHLLLLVRLLLAMQLDMANISIACRKLDQMLQHLAKVNHQLVFRETLQCLHCVVHRDQDSTIGRDVWRATFPDLLDKMSQLFPVAFEQDGLRNGTLCYAAIKMFQLLPGEVAPLVWETTAGGPKLQSVLQSLMDVILGQRSNRDTRLLAGTAVAMLINTAPDNGAGGLAASSLLKISGSEPWLLSIGVLRVHCASPGRDGVDRLAVSRGLLMCCRTDILLTPSEDSTKGCLLLADVFCLVCTLCQEKLDCHYYVFEVLTLWLKKAKDSLPAIWEMIGIRLLPDWSNLQQRLIQVIWNNAESPVEGVSEDVRSAFRLLLELYEKDCQRFGDTTKTLYLALLQRVTKLPWEARAKYPLLCALIPYLGADVVLDHYPELPNHLLKCLSTNHLSPCASDLHKCLIQQQRQDLCRASPDAPPTELELANHWARPWLPVLLEALSSKSTLLQTNAFTQLLPATLQAFPGAVQPLMAALEPDTPENLHAWACVLAISRASTGGSPWTLQGDSGLRRLWLALGSADDRVRIAAHNLLCCSPKTKDAPRVQELSAMRVFVLQNLNGESSTFRQHFQAGMKRFLVRIRDSCLQRVRASKVKNKGEDSSAHEGEAILEQGVDFVEWLSLLCYSYLAPGHSYQRKKTALLLLSVLLETCTDTWSPEKKKGQPPVNMSALINWARQREQWDFFCRAKQLTLIGCLEDSTNEIRELSAGLLLRYFPPVFPDNISSLLLERSRLLLCSPRVPQAQMGALMMKVLLQKCPNLQQLWTDQSAGDRRTQGVVRDLVKELERHYLMAKADVLLAARTTPLHGALSTLERCLLEGPDRLCDMVDHSVVVEVLGLLENIALLLLGVLYGAQENGDAPPSFCDMGNAINSLIAQATPGGRGGREEEEECILLSEEHGLLLTCCWVSLKGVGIFLGLLVERLLAESKPDTCLLTTEDLKRASKVFKNIFLKCRHWGAVEGCGVGFIRFCAALLCSGDPEWRDIPAHMLRQGLQVVRSPRPSSVTRRAAGLPMLLLCVASAEEANRSRPLLSHSVGTLLDTARAPLPDNWDQTLDLPQVCAVHTLQALVRGSGLGGAMLQFASDVAILSLTLLRSPCWAMRNAALQLYSSLCSRMLGQRPGGAEDGLVQHGMSAPAFFLHHPALQPFLLGELRGAALDLQGPAGEARLHLHPSLYPILTLLAKLQPSVPEPTRDLSGFLAPLLQLAASPIHSVRVMASKALVATTTPSEYTAILLQLTAQLPQRHDRCCHNRLHGQLLQTKALLDRALSSNRDGSSELEEVVSRVESSYWLATRAQRCPLVQAAYLAVIGTLRALCSQAFLHQLSGTLLHELTKPQHRLQVGSLFYQQTAARFLCVDPVWAGQMWESFSSASPDLKLSLVTWVVEGCGLSTANLQQVIRRELQANLKGVLLSDYVEYRRSYLEALVAAMTTRAPPSTSSLAPHASQADLVEGAELQQCLELLLGDLEAQRGGPELLSQALCAASVLLANSPQGSALHRWCSILESHCSPGTPEVLRAACAEALCLAGNPLLSLAGTEHTDICPDISARLINTCLYLLQDEDQHVRMTAARFASVLRHFTAGGQGRVHLMQVNQEVPFVMDFLLESCWEGPATLGVLLGHLPEPDLPSVLREARETRCSNLYEQDDANVFAEPSVMAAFLLPRLLQMADKCPECPALAQRLRAWASENAPRVLDDVAACTALLPGDTLTDAWLSLLMHSRFHSTMCGLLARAALLLRLLKISSDLRTLADPLTLQHDTQEVLALLGQNGLHFPSTFMEAVAEDWPL
ncbi:Thyroid adenoma-associated [Merluccius polli]|uniref:Thyroid adenoma-associated n=1 Tax=Merluccius polli TaxID=89951 RepID=A0AA47P971_MERPO|nr:Thyroid adenoma-associated [Merluccius polli]